MNKKEANNILCEYMQDDSCMCFVHNICPSPSSHHDFCINENCKKKITDTTQHSYIHSLDTLAKVWLKMDEDYPEFGGIILYSVVSKNDIAVDISSNLDVKNGGFETERVESSSIQESYAIATATTLLNLQNN